MIRADGDGRRCLMPLRGLRPSSGRASSGLGHALWALLFFICGWALLVAVADTAAAEESTAGSSVTTDPMTAPSDDSQTDDAGVSADTGESLATVTDAYPGTAGDATEAPDPDAATAVVDTEEPSTEPPAPDGADVAPVEGAVATATDAGTTSDGTADDATATSADPTATATDPTATDPTATATDPTATATDPTATDPTATATDPTATATDPTATATDPTATDPMGAVTDPTAAQVTDATAPAPDPTTLVDVSAAMAALLLTPPVAESTASPIAVDPPCSAPLPDVVADPTFAPGIDVDSQRGTSVGSFPGLGVHLKAARPSVAAGSTVRADSGAVAPGGDLPRPTPGPVPQPPPSQPAAPAAPPPGPMPAGPGCATTGFTGAGYGGGTALDQLAVLQESLRTTADRAWTLLSQEIAARVLSGADTPAARPD